MSCRRILALLCLATLALATPRAQGHVNATAKFIPATAAPGDEVSLVIELAIEDGWHIYGAKEQDSIPTTLELPEATRAGLVPVGAAQIEDGTKHESGGLTSYWLAGNSTVKQRLKVPAAATGTLTLHGEVKFMACTEQACDPPSGAPFTATLQVGGAAAPAPAAATLTGPNGKLKASVRAEPASAAPGSKVKVVASCEMVPGWHVYGALEKGAGIPIALELTQLAGASLAGAAKVPAGKPHLAGSQTSYWVAGKFELSREVTLAADAKGTLELGGVIDYMACDDKSCLPPAKLPFTVKVEVGDAGVASAQDGAKPTPTPQTRKQPEQRYEDKDGKLTMRPRVEPWPAHPGETVRLLIDVEVIDGWHVYGSKEDQSVPTSLSLSGLDGLRAQGDASVPPGNAHDMGSFTSYELKGKFTIEQKLAVPESMAPGVTKFTAKVAYMPCDDSGCLNPTAIEMPVEVLVEAGTARGAGAETPTTPSDSGEPTSLWSLLLAAFFGGLLALAMPCTYPMIPITFSFFTKQAEQRGGKVLSLALIYGLGIVLMFIAIGLAVGPVIIRFAGHWGTNAVFAAAFLLFALSLFGLFSLELPSFIQNAAGRASAGGGVVGVFLMGLTLVVTSFTCTAPVVGLLLTQAVEGNTTSVVLGMGTFGLTMALPFVVLSLLPGKVRQLPRSGEWMNALKVTLGFVELVAALKFFSNVDVYFGWKILPREVFLALTAGLFGITALYLFGVPRRPARMGPLRIASALLFVALTVWTALGIRAKELDIVLAGLSPPYGFERKTIHTVVKDDPAQALALAKAEGKLVLHNYTGFFCSNCRVMEEMFFDGELGEAMKATVVESRQHVDVQTTLTDEQFATNKRMQAEMVGTEAMPFYVLVDPKTGQVLRKTALTSTPATWKKMFLEFLQGPPR